MAFFWDFLKNLAAGLWASEASSANKSRREAENAEAVYTQACISERSVGEAGRPKRAKRARANSRRESRVGKAGGHQPVWVPVSLTLRCRPPTPIFVGSEVRGYDSPKSIVKWMKWKQILGLVFFWNFICYRGCLNLNCYMGKKVQKIFLMGLKIWWIWGSRL